MDLEKVERLSALAEEQRSLLWEAEETIWSHPETGYKEWKTHAYMKKVLEGLGQTRALIAQAYAGFNAAGDPDLIESYVFEINALQARYSYLLRRVKELDGDAAVGCGPR